MTTLGGPSGAGSGVSGWKTRITSTMKTNSKINALLNDSLNLMSLVKKKNLIKLKDKLRNNNDDMELIVRLKHLKFDDNDPLTTLKISSEKLFGILVETINDQLNIDTFFYTYNSQISSKFCQILSREINSNIKMLQYQRFRIVSLVTICEKQQQSIDYKMAFSIQSKTDNFATYTYENASLYIVATVFLVYKD